MKKLLVINFLIKLLALEKHIQYTYNSKVQSKTDDERILEAADA